MNTDKSIKFDSPPVVASIIVAVGLIVAATINSHKAAGQGTRTSEAQSLTPGTPSEASVREQLFSQINEQYGGRSETLFGKAQKYGSVSIDKIQIATKGDKINILYEVHWLSGNTKTDTTTGTGDLLIKDDYGHFTNVNTISAEKNMIHPHLDIQ